MFWPWSRQQLSGTASQCWTGRGVDVHGQRERASPRCPTVEGGAGAQTHADSPCTGRLRHTQKAGTVASEHCSRQADMKAGSIRESCAMPPTLTGLVLRCFRGAPAPAA